MIATLFGLTRLPPWARHVIDALTALLAASVAIGLWLRAHDRAVIEKHESKVAQQVQTKASEAATAASTAIAQSKQEVEQSNAKARTAAAGSDDPLRTAFDSLRHDERQPGATAH